MFIKKFESAITFYINDMNLVSTLKNLSKTVEYLKKFEVKYLGKTKLYLGLKLEHRTNGILVQQSAYTKRIFKHFNIDKVYQLSTSMVV